MLLIHIKIMMSEKIVNLLKSINVGTAFKMQNAVKNMSYKFNPPLLLPCNNGIVLSISGKHCDSVSHILVNVKVYATFV